MPEITTIQDLVTIADQGPRERWWRGHALEEYRLVPSLLRSEALHCHELTITSRFMVRAPTRYSPCPDDSDMSGWLFLMQHHRLPTRLLDWSLSPLIAAYFAVTHRKDTPGTLWVIDPLRLNAISVGQTGICTPGNQYVTKHFAAAFCKDIEAPESTVAVLPNESSLRMLAQQSVFTIHGTSTPLEEHPDCDKFLTKFEIPAAAKESMLRQLHRLGMAEADLFPDLDHLASEIAGTKFTS